MSPYAAAVASVRAASPHDRTDMPNVEVASGRNGQNAAITTFCAMPVTDPTGTSPPGFRSGLQREPPDVTTNDRGAVLSGR